MTAALCAGGGFRVVLASGDSDFYALLSGRVSLVRLLPRPTAEHPSAWHLVTARDFAAAYGFPAERYLHYLSLVGEPSTRAFQNSFH
jgi:hypothetical protein